ncbi:MAG: insulinase family protein [Candidatus Omnitrophica bacterium]|nr:insulinase family protein [Candidatus Omnitrophota bacterium]
MYEFSVLENGLKAVTCKLANTRSAAVGLWVKTGGRYEPKKLSGISHFFEHIVFKGSKKRSYRQIKESIEGVGGMLNGFTSEEVTCFLAKVLSKHIPVALDVLLDMLLNPLIRQSDIDKERLVIFEEIKMYFDLPHHLAYDNLQKMLWPEHALGRNLAGEVKTLNGINKEQLLQFKKKYYDLSNMLICVCGDIEHSQLLKMLDGVFKHKGRSSKKKYKNSGSEQVSVNQREPRVSLINKETQQSHIALGTHSLTRIHPLRYALILLHIILGANMSSRLFNEVREKRGYAYEIATAVKRYDDTGAFIVHAGVVNKKLIDACSLILKELKKTCKSPVKATELLRAKEYFSGQMLMSLDDNLDRMVWVGEKLVNNRKVLDPTEIIKAVDAVTPDEIMKVGNLIFSKGNFNLSVVGPVDEGRNKKLLDLLKEFKT